MGDTYRVGGSVQLTVTTTPSRLFVTRRGGCFLTMTYFGTVRSLSPRIVTVWFGHTGFGQKLWRFNRKTGVPWDDYGRDVIASQFDGATAVCAPDHTFEPAQEDSHG